jgi:hypothetical protein
LVFKFLLVFLLLCHVRSLVELWVGCKH